MGKILSFLAFLLISPNKFLAFGDGFLNEFDLYF